MTTDDLMDIFKFVFLNSIFTTSIYVLSVSVRKDGSGMIFLGKDEHAL